MISNSTRCIGPCPAQQPSYSYSSLADPLLGSSTPVGACGHLEPQISFPGPGSLGCALLSAHAFASRRICRLTMYEVDGAAFRDVRVRIEPHGPYKYDGKRRWHVTALQDFHVTKRDESPDPVCRAGSFGCAAPIDSYASRQSPPIPKYRLRGHVSPRTSITRMTPCKSFTDL